MRYYLRSFVSPEVALRSYFWRLKRLGRRDSRCILLAAMPKSASTFLSNIIAEILGYQHGYLAFAYHNIEQELYLPKLIDSWGRGTVVQQHVRANKPNLKILEEFRLRPVVLTRNLFDIVVSLRNHLLNERPDNIPSLYLSEEFESFGTEQQLDTVITLYVPWLVAFYVSWANAETRSAVPMMWLRYEDCIADWPGAASAILDFHGLEHRRDVLEDRINRASAAAARRTNRGVAGRGLSVLNERQIDAVVEVTRLYPEIDFSRVGIDSESAARNLVR